MSESGVEGLVPYRSLRIKSDFQGVHACGPRYFTGIPLVAMALRQSMLR